jgi:hypothetical protein
MKKHRYTDDYKSKVIDRLLREKISVEELARTLRQEEFAKVGRAAAKGEQIPAWQTPHAATIGRWIDSHGPWVRLWRELTRVGPLTAGAFYVAVELLEWDNGEAANRLGVNREDIARWKGGIDPPATVAAHMRTIAEWMVGKPPPRHWKARKS